MLRPSRSSFILSILLASFALLEGCAWNDPSWRPPEEPTDPKRLDYAYRIFNLAKAEEKKSRFEFAIGLYRQTVLVSPQTRRGDHLRHVAIGRLVQALHENYRIENDIRQLLIARNILSRYLVRHSHLFGKDDIAQRERSSYFEALTAIETAIEQHQIIAAKTSNSRAEVASTGDLTANGVSSESTGPENIGSKNSIEHAPRNRISRNSAPDTQSNSGTSRPPRETKHPRKSSEIAPLVINPYVPKQTTAPIVPLSTGNRRNITVRRAQQPSRSVVDPLERSRFDDPFVSDAPLPAMSIETSYDTAVYVRFGRPRLTPALDTTSSNTRPKTLGRGQKQVARKHLEGIRDQLERCYLLALGRDPWLYARVEIEFSVVQNRILYAEMGNGDLIDTAGNQCVQRALDTPLKQDSSDTTIGIRVPIHFFYSGPATYSGDDPRKSYPKVFNAKDNQKKKEQTIDGHPLKQTGTIDPRE